MNKTDAVQWADEHEREYADRFIETSDILKEHDVYGVMGGYFAMATAALRSEYEIPQNRPFVHIDIGCGTGYTLQEMDAALREMDREKGREQSDHLLIGIDINRYMCRKAVTSLMEKGSSVVHHIASHRGFADGEKGQVFKHAFPIHHDALEKMDMTPDGRTMILQDDIFEDTSVLGAVLEQLRRRYQISHVDSISFAQPGLGGDTAMSDKNIDEISILRESKIERNKATGTYLGNMIDRVSLKAKDLLGYGGSLLVAHRMINGEEFVKAHTFMTGEPFPEDEVHQNMAQINMAMLTLGKNGVHFRPKLGAVLYPNYQEVQSLTPIQYGGLPVGGGKMGKDLKSYDLFGLAALRQDLHPMGNRLSSHSVRLPGTDPQE